MACFSVFINDLPKISFEVFKISSVREAIKYFLLGRNYSFLGEYFDCNTHTVNNETQTKPYTLYANRGDPSVGRGTRGDPSVGRGTRGDPSGGTRSGGRNYEGRWGGAPGLQGLFELRERE